jgi:hypothetical protein
MQPELPITFDEIFNMSVQQDPTSVRQLALKLRHHLDVNADYEISQLPVQQLADDIQVTKQRNKLQNALIEHSSSNLI